MVVEIKMKFSDRDKTMFQTVFTPSADEARTVLDYVRYLWDERIGEQLAEHPLYRPSALWKHWAGQTFTGFSLEKILLQGRPCLPVLGRGRGTDNGERKASRWRRCLGALLGGRGTTVSGRDVILRGCRNGSGDSTRRSAVCPGA